MNPFEPRPFSQGDLAKVIEITRNTTIKECARVADEMANDYGERNYSRLAAAIRALKDKR